MPNIWKKLKKPIFILAPMEDVTDTVFRRVVLDCGKPDLVFTEFTSVDGMFSKGDKIVGQRLQFTKMEKPIIAQIWGMKPENYFKAGKLLREMGFDGIDINMGCPEKSVIKNGACSALINSPSLAREIIQATKEGIREAVKSVDEQIPVSVKTRIGFKDIKTIEWIGFLLLQNLDAITIHGRTASEMSKALVHWDEIKKCVEIRNEKKLETLILGNGDVLSLKDAREKVEEFGLDGIMIGRGIFYNPWFFNETVDPQDKNLKDRLELLWKHVKLYDKHWGNNKPFQVLKKYFKIYISGFDGAREIRIKLMETKNKEEAEKVVKEYLPSLID